MKDTEKLRIQILITKNVCMCICTCVCEHICCTQRLFGCSGSTGACRRRCAGWCSGFTGCCGSSSIFGGSGGASLIRGGGASLWHRGALLCSCLRRGWKTENTGDDRWREAGQTERCQQQRSQRINQKPPSTNEMLSALKWVREQLLHVRLLSSAQANVQWLHWEIQVKDFAPMSVNVSPSRPFKIAYFIQQHVSTPAPCVMLRSTYSWAILQQAGLAELSQPAPLGAGRLNKGC